jgi:hypothetical protein
LPVNFVAIKSGWQNRSRIGFLVAAAEIVFIVAAKEWLAPAMSRPLTAVSIQPSPTLPVAADHGAMSWTKIWRQGD